VSTPAPLRVLTISKPYVSRLYRDKIQEWARAADIAPGLVCPPQWGSQGYEDETAGIQNPYPVFKVPIRLNGHNHFHYYRGLEAAIQNFRPHVLNIEEEHYSLVTWQACRIAVRHGVVPIFYTWQNIAKRYPPPFSWIEQYVFRHCPAAVAGNEEARDILVQKGFRGPIAVIPQMGVDVQRFMPREPGEVGRRAAKIALGLDPEKFWIVFPGRVVEEKGLDELVAALKGVASPDICLAVIGDGPYLKTLRETAAGLVAQGKVVFIGAVPSAAVPDYLVLRKIGKSSSGESSSKPWRPRPSCWVPIQGKFPELSGMRGFVSVNGTSLICG
jgi:glycosyltransferase involved in cell wall biosynthesis